MRWCFLVMVLAGCGSATNPTPRTRVASITVTPVTDRLPVGNHLTLVAVAVAGKPTLVRVWVTGNPSTQASRPVALELFRHDVLDTTMIGMTAPTLPPGRTDELATSVNFLLPATIDLRDVSLRAIVDPDGELAEADEFDNRWPRDHRLVLGAPVQLPPLRATFVPVALQEGLGSITLGPEDVARYDTAFKRMLPMVSTSPVS